MEGQKKKDRVEEKKKKNCWKKIEEEKENKARKPQNQSMLSSDPIRMLSQWILLLLFLVLY